MQVTPFRLKNKTKTKPTPYLAEFPNRIPYRILLTSTFYLELRKLQSNCLVKCLMKLALCGARILICLLCSDRIIVGEQDSLFFFVVARDNCLFCLSPLNEAPLWVLIYVTSNSPSPFTCSRTGSSRETRLRARMNVLRFSVDCFCICWQLTLEGGGVIRHFNRVKISISSFKQTV